MRIPIDDVVSLLLDIEEARMDAEHSAKALRAIQERLARAMAKYGVPSTGVVQDMAGVQVRED